MSSAFELNIKCTQGSEYPGHAMARMTNYQTRCRNDVNTFGNIIICPIAIAYSIGQIIKSVCVCQSVCQCVYLSVCEHSHGRIS